MARNKSILRNGIINRLIGGYNPPRAPYDNDIEDDLQSYLEYKVALIGTAAALFTNKEQVGYDLSKPGQRKDCIKHLVEKVEHDNNPNLLLDFIAAVELYTQGDAYNARYTDREIARVFAKELQVAYLAKSKEQTTIPSKKGARKDITKDAETLTTEFLDRATAEHFAQAEFRTRAFKLADDGTTIHEDDLPHALAYATSLLDIFVSEDSVENSSKNGWPDHLLAIGQAIYRQAILPQGEEEAIGEVQLTRGRQAVATWLFGNVLEPYFAEKIPKTNKEGLHTNITDAVVHQNLHWLVQTLKTYALMDAQPAGEEEAAFFNNVAIFMQVMSNPVRPTYEEYSRIEPTTYDGKRVEIQRTGLAADESGESVEDRFRVSEDSEDEGIGGNDVVDVSILDDAGGSTPAPVAKTCDVEKVASAPRVEDRFIIQLPKSSGLLGQTIAETLEEDAIRFRALVPVAAGDEEAAGPSAEQVRSVANNLLLICAQYRRLNIARDYGTAKTERDAAVGVDDAIVAADAKTHKNKAGRDIVSRLEIAALRVIDRLDANKQARNQEAGTQAELFAALETAIKEQIADLALGHHLAKGRKHVWKNSRLLGSLMQLYCCLGHTKTEFSDLDEDGSTFDPALPTEKAKALGKIEFTTQNLGVGINTALPEYFGSLYLQEISAQVLRSYVQLAGTFRLRYAYKGGSGNHDKKDAAGRAYGAVTDVNTTAPESTILNTVMAIARAVKQHAGEHYQQGALDAQGKFTERRATLVASLSCLYSDLPVNTDTKSIDPVRFNTLAATGANLAERPELEETDSVDTYVGLRHGIATA